MNRNWRLPAGVDELLPPAAWALEQLRRRVLDVFRLWGFEYIEPPIVDYLDALLVGAGDDLDLQTLKTVDQRSGRLLGVRADMTAQAVRVDAHSLPVEGVQRLCYAGNLVLANPLSALESRVPLKAGAEIFGTASLAADAEVIALMLEVLSSAGLDDAVVVIGHMGIYRALSEGLPLAPAVRAELFTAVQSKAETDIAALVTDSARRELLVRLPTLMGGGEVLAESRRVLASMGGCLEAIDALEHLAELVLARCPKAHLRFDLAELVGYGYHNGPVFSAYHADQGRALARGGRYDGVGAGFGRSRPATGFDVSLKALVGAGVSDAGSETAVWVPWNDGLDPAADSARAASVEALRARGVVVVMALAADDERPARCDRELVLRGGSWVEGGARG